MINGENFLSGKSLIKNLTNWRLINSLLPSAIDVSFFSSAIACLYPAAGRVGQGPALSAIGGGICHKPLS
jgi:hypothetical protein